MRASSLVALVSILRVSAYASDPYFPSIPEDPYAFPKYRLSFLNGLSVSNATALQWLADGLVGGEQEFLSNEPYPHPPASIDSSVSHPDDLSFPEPPPVRHRSYVWPTFLYTKEYIFVVK